MSITVKCGCIVSHFKYSTKASYNLLKMQEQLKLDTLKLKQDVRTRWNSTFYMLERLLQVKISLSATLPLLDSPPTNLDSNEWLLTEDVVALLRPFENVTAILSGEKYPTLSLVIPFVLRLRRAIDSKTPELELGKCLKRSLSSIIEKRLGVYETNRTASKAFLDSRFTKKGFMFESNAHNAQMWVINEISNMTSIEDLLILTILVQVVPVFPLLLLLLLIQLICIKMTFGQLWIKESWRAELSQLHTLQQL